MTPIQLRTVRPFVLDSIVLQDIAEEQDLDLTNQMAITKYLKSRVQSFFPVNLFVQTGL